MILFASQGHACRQSGAFTVCALKLFHSSIALVVACRCGQGCGLGVTWFYTNMWHSKLYLSRWCIAKISVHHDDTLMSIMHDLHNIMHLMRGQLTLPRYRDERFLSCPLRTTIHVFLNHSESPAHRGRVYYNTIIIIIICLPLSLFIINYYWYWSFA